MEIHTLPLSEALDTQGVDDVLTYIAGWCRQEGDRFNDRPADDREATVQAANWSYLADQLEVLARAVRADRLSVVLARADRPWISREAMQRHYDHYRRLVARGELSSDDEPQWRLARQRKSAGLVD